MRKVILLVLIFPLFLAGCKFDSSAQYAYKMPESIDDGFKVGSLNDVNINEKLIEKLINKINKRKYKEIHSLLIYKDGKLVLEEYFKAHAYKYNGAGHHGELKVWDRTMLQNTHSVTKSITSACIGIAIEQGFIKGVNQSIFDYLPQYQNFNKEGKESITIEHLLTMTSGFDWNESGIAYGNSKNDIIELLKHDDPIAYILNKPMVNKPGVNFNYNGGCSILLGEILKNATKMNIDEFSGKFLFGPLGTEAYYWKLLKNNVIYASGDIDITPRDMLKIGVTFLHNGYWKEQQIITEKWINKCAISYPANNWGDRGYAYSWWTRQYALNTGTKLNMYYADGWGGQFIMVFPQINTVAVFTGSNYVTEVPSFEILEKYIIPAIK